MKRLLVVLALTLAACSSPTEPDLPIYWFVVRDGQKLVGPFDTRDACLRFAARYTGSTCESVQ